MKARVAASALFFTYNNTPMKKCYWSRLRVLTWAVLFAAGSFASCSDDDKKGDNPPPPPPPVELKDQIEYDGGKLIDIKSAIFDVEDTDLYTFYLSPTAGVVDVAGMEAANDYLLVQVRNPKGSVNVDTDTFEIAYKDIRVKKQTMSDIEKVQLMADLMAETQRLNLYVEVVLKTGKKLLARYNNTCVETLPVALENQFELDRQITEIGSVVAWNNPLEATTTYYFYKQSGITAPSADLSADMEIIVPDDMKTDDIDLFKADPAKLKIACGEFRNSAGTTGKFSLTRNEGTLTLAIDALDNNSHLRAAYTGAFAAGSTVRNYLKIKIGDKTAETELTRIFRYSKGLTSYYGFGTNNAETPEGLMVAGQYAFHFGAGNLAIGTTADVGKVDNPYDFKLFDYETYETYDVKNTNGFDITGTITTKGTPEKLYLKFSVEFPHLNMTAEGEWFGDATAAEEFDLTPVKPFEPHLTIVTKDNEGLVQKKITRMEVRMEQNKSIRGNKINAYFFYFIPEGFDESEGVESGYISQLMIPEGYLNRTELGLGTAQDGLYWSFKYAFCENSLQYGQSGYSEKYTFGGATTYGNCPDDAKVTVVRKEDKTWEVSFFMTDSGSSTNFAGEAVPWGSQNKLSIEWRGPATKYSGTTKKNDLTDADY